MNRSKNAKRNIASGLVNNSISLLIPFLMRTLIIRLFGAEYLGLNGLFSSILQVLSLTELGFESAIVFSMYEPIAKNKTEELCALLKLYRKIYTIVGFVILLSGLCVLPILPRFIKGSWPDEINIYVLYLIHLLNTSISYFLFAYKNSLFAAYQRNDVLSKIHLIVKIVVSLFQIYVIVFWKNYYAYTGVVVLGSVATNISVHVLSQKAFPDIVCKGTLPKEKMDEIKVKVKGLMINRLCQTSRNALDNIFVSSFIGLVDTAKYNNYFTILSAASGIMCIFRDSIVAGVGNSMVVESKEKNIADMMRLNYIYMWIAGWFSACLICLYQPFTELMFGVDMLFPFHIAVMFTMYFYLLKMGDMRYVYTEAAGLWWENRYRAIVETVANVVLNYTLGKYFGVAGIIAATLLSVFFVNFIWGSLILYQSYFSDFKVLQFYKQHAFYATVGVISTGITYAACSLIISKGVIGLFIRSIICVIFPNIILLLIYFKTKTFQDAVLWIDKRFHLPGFMHLFNG